MTMTSLFVVLLCCIVLSEAFFSHDDLYEPILFCLKICPLYCSPRYRRSAGDRYRFDSGDESYNSYPNWEPPYPSYEYTAPPPWNISPEPTPRWHTSPEPTRSWHTSPKPTTPRPTSPKPTTPRPTSPRPTTPKPTSPRPTSTTMEPSWICMVCNKKCNYPG